MPRRNERLLRHSSQGRTPMKDLFLAATILAAPVGTPELVPCPERFQEIRDAISTMAQKWEIMDPKEDKYLLTNPEYYQSEIDILRQRYVQFKDAPMVRDAQRLPTIDKINELIKFNRNFKKSLDERLLFELDRENLILEAIRETDVYHLLWIEIRHAQSEFLYVTGRRESLLKVKEFLGEERYISGELPPYVPHWRFSTK